MTGVRVFDDFLPGAEAYRARALALDYATFSFPDATFHGIAIPPAPEVPAALKARFPALTPTLTFLRRSPLGQKEPHFIHTDVDMGEWSALLHLTAAPLAGDGTAFWRHLATGEIENGVPHERSAEGQTTSGWKRWNFVRARFNRLIIWPAAYYHSRAIFDNYGKGDDARLTQVTFGTGDL